MIGTVAAPVLPAMGLPGAGLPSSVRRRILPSGWLGSWAGVMRCRSPTVRKRYWLSGEKATSAPNCPPLPLSPSRQMTWSPSRLAASLPIVSWARASARLEPPSPGSE